MDQFPRDTMTGRLAHPAVVLEKACRDVVSLTGVVSSGFLTVKDVDEEDHSEEVVTWIAIAPEGRRGDLYPAELRARPHNWT